ncbi:hypothetical protein EDB19DRAFT_1910373 [Suillus lakei]|nr:hypothetical protein EDB19DRAFT_1910373 [Suillus lakei]
MSVITQITNIKTSMAIWEFNPNDCNNHVLGNLLDVVATVCTIAIKIQCSGQWIDYFKTLQKNCSLENTLKIPLHSNVRWGTADGMLRHAYTIQQVINIFISTADELFGPVTVIQHNGKLVKNIPWTAFTFKNTDWEHVNDAREIIADANNIQQYFSSETQPTLWHAILAIKELQTAWEMKCDLPKLASTKSGKYYQKFDDKPVYVLVLILHPYYKLVYIKMQWGRPKEQAKEHAARNPNAIYWYDEALQVIEAAMQEYSQRAQPTTP